MFWVIFMSILGAISYRLGGIGKPFRSWMRDWILPLIGAITMWFILDVHTPIWTILLSYLLLGVSLTTYYDELFGFDNMGFHLFVACMAYFPYVIYTGHWWLFGVRALICGFVAWFLNWQLGQKGVKYSDIIEEMMRGFILIITLPMIV